MQLIRFESPRGWLARAQAALEREEAKHNLQVGIVVRLAEHPDRVKHRPYLAVVEEDGEFVAAAVMTPPHRVVVSSVRGGDPEPLLLFIRNLLDEGWQAPGAIGESSVVRAFSRLWTETTGRAHVPAMRQRIYELRRVSAPAGVRGSFRAAVEEEVDLVAGWVRAFTIECGLPGAPEEAASIAAQRIAERDIYLWEVDGRPVSMAARTRHSTHGITVSLVYTPPDERRHGYASACVAALSQRLLDAGWEFCTLYTDLSNPTSNAIYQQIGYVPVCDSNEYDFALSEESSGKGNS